MTFAEHSRRTAPELRIFDLPRQQELHLRALLWKDIRNFNARLGMGRHAVALDFNHFMEFSEALLGGKPSPGQKVLVLGAGESPLALYIASKGCETHLVDYDPRVLRQEAYAREAGLGSLLTKRRLVIRKAELAHSGYADGEFDYVVALSCIDRTRDDGDVELFREAARVVRPGGLVSVSLRYGRKWQEGQEGRLPFRVYTQEALNDRLLHFGELQVLRSFFFAEDTVGLGPLWGKLPSFLRQTMLGWVVYPIGQAVAIGDVSNKRNATRIVLLLQKPTDQQTHTPVATPSVTQNAG